MRQIALFLILLLLVPLAGLAAQEAPSLAPGAQVRVTTSTFSRATRSRDQTRWVGTFVALNADTLVFRTKDQTVPLAIPVASVTRLDVSRGQVPGGNHTGIGAGIGAFAGGTVGALSTYAYWKHLESSLDVPGDLLILGFILGSFPGAAIGAAIGSLTGGDRWERVPLERVRLSVAPQRQGGVRLAASFVF